MKKLIITGFFAVICGLLPAAGFALSISSATELCQREAQNNPPQIEIRYNYGNLKINHRHTSSELGKMMSKMYPVKINHSLNGLTRLSPFAVIDSDIVQSPKGNYLCYYPQTVRVTVGYEPVVYIRSDLEEDSCRYKVTMRHELTHLDIGYLSLQQFLQKIKSIFPLMVKNAGIITIAADKGISAQETSTELNNKYQRQMSRLFDDFIKEMIKQQMRIDSADDYKAEGALCR